MRILAYRFLPGTDIKKELKRIAEENGLQAGFILTCAGSLSKAVLRMAGAQPKKQETRTYDEELEIVSIEGTLSLHGMHVHLGLSRMNGESIGGHLKEGCIVKTTAEVVIGEDPNLQFTREEDKGTGFAELVIKPR